MGLDAWLALGATVGALVAMAAVGVAADRALSIALAALLLGDVVDPARALSGFSNTGVATVALLFLVAAGVRRSGALEPALRVILGRTRSVRLAQLRLMFPVAALSGFLNNTPVVAMLLPDVRRWGSSRGIAPSLLLIPLSYATILGGMCTLIGSSTNLLVDGLLHDHGLGHFELFTIARLGVPAAIAGMLVMILLATVLLPRRDERGLPLADPREFTAELVVEVGGPLVGKRLRDISAPGLRSFAPVEIQRDGAVIAAPRSAERLAAGDVLVFAAPSAAVLAMHRLAGLAAADARREGDGRGPAGALVEAVIGPRCPLIGQSVGDGSFRRHYGAAVIAVARDGRRVAAAGLGAWEIEVGDTVLLEADEEFAARHRYGTDLILVTAHDAPAVHAGWHAPFSLAVLAAMATAAALGMVSMFAAALGATVALLGARVISWHDAAREIDGRVMLAIVAAIGLGTALEDTGAAHAIASGLVSMGGDSPWLTLGLVYGATAITTELVTNNAAAVLMVPIALSAAAGLGVSPMPFVAVVMIAASASFITPIGYQTNLMVYGPGGYRFLDFVRAGAPVSLAVAAVTIALAPYLFPF